MLADTDASQGQLDAIANRLRTASTDLEGTATPPQTPEAGDATGILASMLSHMTLSMDGAVTGLGAAGDAVAESRNLFQQTEDANREDVGKQN